MVRARNLGDTQGKKTGRNADGAAAGLALN
jgi:hypothetical protein